MSSSRPLVIGLAGGIGSGKSAVARILQELGCLVIDSDAEARKALERPDVKNALSKWWGEAVIDPHGRIDRSAVASIVFADEAQRRRLEGLIHPLVRRSRAEIIAEAPDVLAAVIDAPLLFEAGVDAECDEVWFIDAPLRERLERVRANRGWDEAELLRRERTQLPLQEKKQRSQRVVVNDGDLEALRRRVVVALAAARAEAR